MQRIVEMVTGIVRAVNGVTPMGLVAPSLILALSAVWVVAIR